VADPYLAFLRLARAFQAELPMRPRGVHPNAVVDPSARIGQDVSIGACAVVEKDASIADGVTLCPGVFVGVGASVGEGSYLFPNVIVLHAVLLGRRVIVHSGTVLGSDGFGYLQRDGLHEKVPQLGKVVVDDDVEIGANVCIDRATLGETRIGKGVKIDNLVHIAHNVVIGAGALIIAQVGIAGSTRVGERAILAGQAGINGHIEIGAGARIAAQAGVFGDVPAGADYLGWPARPRGEAMRRYALVERLPQMQERLKELERKMRALEGESA